MGGGERVAGRGGRCGRVRNVARVACSLGRERVAKSAKNERTRVGYGAPGCGGRAGSGERERPRNLLGSTPLRSRLVLTYNVAALGLEREKSHET